MENELSKGFTGDRKMKNIKEKKCKNCKGRGFVPMGEGMKGLTQCPVCLGSGLVKKDSEIEK